MKDISLEELNQEAKERVSEIEKQLNNEFDFNNNYLNKLDVLIDQIKNRLNDDKLEKEYMEENLSYQKCLELIKDSIGIKCKYCGSNNIIPYYYGILYPSIIESKYITLDKNYKYGGIEKNENWKPFYCNDCKRDFSCY